MNVLLYEFAGVRYPSYLKGGNATRFISPFAKQFCTGVGYDVGANNWPLQGAHPIDITRGTDALNLPVGDQDYIYSSHLLEHLPNPVAAIEHWKSKLREGGVLFLYLPHPDMAYWRPQNCRKHLHTLWPKDVAGMLTDLGFVDVLHSERDLAWSFAVVGWKGATV